MLKSLYIENIAIIEKATIDFECGFIVLSGETGAGKSIIIDAINGIMGAKARRDLIRHGAESAVVIGEFSVDDTLSQLLENMGYGTQDTLVVLREMRTDGKNICKINGKPAPLTALKELGTSLIEVHGQHDGQNLLNEENHINYLDEYAGNTAVISAYTQCYEELLALNRRIKNLSLSIKQKAEYEAKLEEEIVLLSELNATDGEFTEYTELRKSTLGRKQIEDALALAALAMNGDDESKSVYDIIIPIIEGLKKAEKYDSALTAIAERAESAVNALDELKSDIFDTISRFEQPGIPFEQLEERLSDIERVAHRLNVSPDELGTALSTRLEAQDELALGTGDIEEQKALYAQKREQTLSVASDLTHSRAQAAVRLKTAVESELSQLAMTGARVSVDIGEAGKFTKTGVDTVAFLLCANAGEAFKPLVKVASGGELSRIMLAIKNVMVGTNTAHTMIFDEIDAGVSGRAANKVGEKLYEISKNKQVICVTHLPQIAAYADAHYLISKSTDGVRTKTEVERLNDNGSASEISRMTGGRDVTETTLKSAKEMIELAKKYKNSTK